MSDDDQDSKTEEPTEKRLFDAAERGEVAVSREAALFASLSAILLAFIFVLPQRVEALLSVLVAFVDDPAGWRLERGADILDLVTRLTFAAASFLAPTVLLLMAAGVIASVAQNAPRIVVDRILPQWSRVSPRSGLRRLLGPRGWSEFAKSLAKFGAVGAIASATLAGQTSALVQTIVLDPSDLPRRVLVLGVRTVAAVLVATLVVAAADLVWTKILWRRDQRMSRQEIKDEIKQAEGDRLVKARLRSLRLHRSRKRMLLAVPRATMIIANPTHYAVALRYVRAEGGAPTVVAKGADLLALKIRGIAEELGISVIEDKPLARSLYDATSVDQTIPPEFYRAVAEIVHLIHERKSSWTPSRSRSLS
jgi:flagellar biosynthetic protein FlhB